MTRWDWYVVKLTDLTESILAMSKQTSVDTLRTAKPGIFATRYALVAFPKYRTPIEIRSKYNAVNLEEELGKPEWNY